MILVVFYRLARLVAAIPRAICAGQGKLVTSVLNNNKLLFCFVWPIIFITAVRMAGEVFGGVLQKMVEFHGQLSTISGTSLSGSSGGFSSVFRSANTILPVIETLQLMFSVAGIWAVVITMKVYMWIWSKVPFKAT